MITREEYLKNSREKFHDYYAQFVTDEPKELVLDEFGLDRLIRAFEQDQNFNTIALRHWDYLGTEKYIDTANFKAINKSLSLSDLVCLAKNAARQLVQGE